MCELLYNPDLSYVIDTFSCITIKKWFHHKEMVYFMNQTYLSEFSAMAKKVNILFSDFFVFLFFGSTGVSPQGLALEPCFQLFFSDFKSYLYVFKKDC
jgi:hypothetical protein